MGEMADYTLDQMFDPEFEDEDGDPDAIRYDDSVWFPRPVVKTCRKCKKTGLHWKFIGYWALYDGDSIHECQGIAIDIGV